VAPLVELQKSSAGVELLVPENYEELALSPELSGEVFAIQRLLTITRLGIPLTVAWAPTISRRLTEIVRLQPLLN